MMTFRQLHRQCKLIPRIWGFNHANASPTIIRFASSDDSKHIMPSVSLTFENSASVAVLTLRNPKRRNALTVDMMEQLDHHVEALSKWASGSTDGIVRENVNDNLNVERLSKHDNARVVILTGSHGNFCSGLDLSDNEQNDSTVDSLKEGANMIRHMTRVTNQLVTLPVLSVCAIDGYAVGGGAELTTCTDLVVLSRNAKIEFVHAKRGASMGWGGGRRLVKKVGRRMALRMLLLGVCVHGEEEASAGGVYADAVAEEGETALEATRRLVVNPILELPCSQSIRAIKKVVSAADGDVEVDSIDGTLEIDTNMAMKVEMDSFLSVWGGDSNKELIQKAKDRLRDKNTKQ